MGHQLRTVAIFFVFLRHMGVGVSPRHCLAIVNDPLTEFQFFSSLNRQRDPNAEELEDGLFKRDRTYSLLLLLKTLFQLEFLSKGFDYKKNQSVMLYGVPEAMQSCNSYLRNG